MDLDLTCVSKLSSLLRENGDKVLNSHNKLSLTVLLLENLNKAFSLFVEDRSSLNSSFEVTHINNYNDETVNSVQFLYDFIQRVESVKISQNVLLLTNPSQSVNVSKFKNLKYLELRKIHIWDVTGIQNLRTQLQSVICVRCVTKISDFLQCCGGDRTTEHQWDHMREAIFSYNTITSLDPSLKLAPLIQVLDISHNRISNTDGLELLENLKYLNLGYNALDCVPMFHKSVHKKLQVLILRNNFIEDLSELFPLECLVELDLSCNCIANHESLLPLSTMKVLTWLSLEGNPLSFVRDHRMYTAAYLSETAVRNEFVLNRLLLSMPEKMVVGTIYKSRFPLRCSKILEDKDRQLSEERKPSTSSTIAICEVHATQNDDEDQELLLSSVEKSKKAGGTRKKGRVREAVILEKNVTDRESELTASTSITDSLTMSEDDLETKKKVEMLRKKFGKDHWLHSEGGSCLRDVLGMQDPTTPILPADIVTIAHEMVLDSVSQERIDNQVIENKHISPDTKNVSENIKEQTCVANNIESEVTAHMDHVDSGVVSDVGVISIIEKGKFCVGEEKEEEKEEEEEVIEEEEEENEPADEDESQMYIVQPCSTAGEKQGHEIFLLVTDSHVKEREMSNAKLREKWALDTLLSCAKLSSSPIIIQLTFDTVRPSRQERNYITDESDSQKLLTCLRAILESRNLSARNQFAYRCMKCSTLFSQELVSTRSLMNETESLPKGVPPVCIKCPTCGSTVVIQMDEEPLPSGSSSVPPDNGTSVVELDAEDALVSSCVGTTSSSEISVIKSSSQSSIGGGSGGAMLQVTAIIHQPASATSPDITAHDTSSAASLDQSPNMALVEAAPIKRWESDIDILSNPSQSSIEILDEYNRTHGNTPIRKRSSEERQTVVISAAPVPSLVSALLGGLTESSSSGSLTDSICTTYKTSPEDENYPAGKREDNTVNDNAKTQNINVFNVPSKQNGSYKYDIIERRKGKLSESSDDTLEGTDISSAEQESSEHKGAGISYSSVLEELLQNMSSKIPIKEETCPKPSSEEIQFSYTDLSVVDHRLKLYLYMHMFEEEQEEFMFLMRCNVICCSSPTPFLGLVVFSSHRVYILRITGKEIENPERWLQKVNTHPADQLTEIQKLPWHQGLGLGIRNGNKKDIYIQYLLIVQDQQRTLDFLTFISGLSLPEKCALTIHSVLERHKLLIQQTVLSSGSSEEDGDTTLRQFLVFSHCSVRHSEGQKDLNLGILMISGTSLIVTQDNLEWMFPESTTTLQPYRTQPMSNLIEIEENDEYELTLHFLDSSDAEESWTVTVPTKRIVEAIIEAIRSPWEQLFSVQLQIVKK